MKSFLKEGNEDASVHKKLIPIDFKLISGLLNIIIVYFS